jgi:2,3,4,5-tetrahydropyridine-2-carboxylate N-succinyltransferase
VLEPAGALPVIVEDEAFVGGGVGIYEGVVVGAGAVLGAGVVLTRSSRVYDLTREEILEAGADRPLVIPPGAVVCRAHVRRRASSRAPTGWDSRRR